MLLEMFDRAVDEVPVENVITFELNSGFRVIVFHRERLGILDGYCTYVEDDGELCFFDATSVARVLSTTRPPMSDRLRPSTNGKH